MSRIHFIIIACFVASLPVGCGSWESTRRDVVQPVQQLLHRDYPAALAAMTPEELNRLYADESASAASRQLWERFARIDRAAAVITSAAESRDSVEATVWLRLEGRDEHDRPVMMEQDRRMACRRQGETWKIATDDGDGAQWIDAPNAHFVDETEQRGLRVRHEPPYLPDAEGTPQRFVLGAGVAVGDLDLDGWEDVIFATEHRLVAYRNLPPEEAGGHRGTFSVATQEWGLYGDLEGALTFTLLLDYDNDGDSDLVVGAHLAQPTLFRNDLSTGGKFVRVADSGINVPSERAITACAADFDGNGWIDLFVGNNHDPYFEAPSPLGVARNAHADQLFLNFGGQFVDRTEDVGIDNTGWSLVCATADYDLDGDIDLFIGNDFGLDVLYRNLLVESGGDLAFEEVASDAEVDAPIASMSADWADYDNDGDFDLFVGGMSSSTGWVIDHPDFPSPVPWLVDTLFRDRVRSEIKAFFHGNRFYENQFELEPMEISAMRKRRMSNASVRFQEVSTATGTHNSQWAWGTCWLDFDNDGHLDLYGSNGFLSGKEKDDL